MSFLTSAALSQIVIAKNDALFELKIVFQLFLDFSGYPDILSGIPVTVKGLLAYFSNFMISDLSDTVNRLKMENQSPNTVSQFGVVIAGRPVITDFM